MLPDELSGPDLTGVVADARAVGLEHVVIGGFSVIFHGYVRATKDSDLLVPDGPEADAAVLRFLTQMEAVRLSDGRTLDVQEISAAEHLRVAGRRGIVDLLRGGLEPLDFHTVSEQADTAEWNGQLVRFASLASLVGFKRLAGRPQDRVDLAELEAIYETLPIEAIPGIDR
jgi:hypothetical protein